MEAISGLREELIFVKEELARAGDGYGRILRERQDLIEALDRSVQEKCILQKEVEVHKVKAKEWKLQLDETTCRLIEKQDEIDALRQT